MSERFTLLPGAYDQVDLISRVLRWWTANLDFLFTTVSPKPVHAEALEQQGARLRGATAVLLSEEDIFVANLALPVGAARHHRNAIDLKLSDLAPKDIASLDIAAAAVEPFNQGMLTYAIAMARKARLAELEKTARKRGARSVVFRPQINAGLDLAGPRTRKQLYRSFLLNAALSLAACAALTAAAMLWTHRIETETRDLEAQASTVRRAALAAETARRDSDLAKAFVDHGVLDRRAGAALKSLAELNRATPDTAWWTSIRWTPEEITLLGESPNAAAAIDAIATDALHWSVELAGPIKSDASGTQTFELRAHKRPAK